MNQLKTKIKQQIVADILKNTESDFWQYLTKELLIKSIVSNYKDKGNNISQQEETNNKVLAGLAKADQKIAAALAKKDKEEVKKDIDHVELDDLDDVDLATLERFKQKGYQIIYPNLKYNKPKYSNVESLLNYVESDKANGEGGVKLVIMNFND